MRNTKVVLTGLVAVVTLGGCVTKGTFRREMAETRNQIATERTERVSGDSAQRAELEALRTQLHGEIEALRTEFGAKVTAMEGSVQFAFPVNFAFDDAMVRPEDQAALDRFASVVSKFYGSSLVTVEGFADPAGSTRYNVGLSQRRADAVREYLVTKGLTSDQLRTVGYGESRLVNPGAERDDPGAAENRRVVFVVETRGTAAKLTASAITGGE